MFKLSLPVTKTLIPQNIHQLLSIPRCSVGHTPTIAVLGRQAIIFKNFKLLLKLQYCPPEHVHGHWLSDHL